MQNKGIKAEVTIITKHKEAAGAEVAVEFDEDLIGSCGHTLLHGVPTELTDLRRSLVWSIPDKGKDSGWYGDETVKREIFE